jgi:hypothetical protein
MSRMIMGIHPSDLLVSPEDTPDLIGGGGIWRKVNNNTSTIAS